MSDLKALAVQAAEWINATPRGSHSETRCHRSLELDRWHVTYYSGMGFLQSTYDADDELIARAKAMGWNPEPAADSAPVFPEGIVWQSDGPFDTDRAAAVREALSGPSFASFTPEQRAEAVQLAISFDIHCKPETVILPTVADGVIVLEILSGAHFTRLKAWGDS